jgi:hypothetical protein
VTALRALTRYAHGSHARAKSERCELCGNAVDAVHAHVVDLERRGLCCACRACALLFGRAGMPTGRYRTVPDRVLVEPDFQLTEARWETLGIPVRLAFVFFNSSLERWIGVYPSPAGPTESEVSLAGWTELGAGSALIGSLEPDVEALLVHGARGQQRFECFLVPIDACYELVARVRRHWKGFDGGPVARQEIEAFFVGLRARSRSVAERAGGTP